MHGFDIGLLLILMAMTRVRPEVGGSIVTLVAMYSLVGLSVAAACSERMPSVLLWMYSATQLATLAYRASLLCWPDRGLL